MPEPRSPNPSRPRRREDLDCHELDGEVILYDHAFNTTYRLNETGYFIWKSCDGSADPQRIARLLTTKYDIAESVARADVQETIATMFKEGLLVTSQEDPRSLCPRAILCSLSS